MMETTYIRDMEHNYMIVRPAGEASEYALRMLQAQPLHTLVPFEERSVNTDRFLYYRIDGLQSLENRCLVRKLCMEELQRLFEALRIAEQELREVLLGVDSLYLTPESVFIDRTSGTYRFTCMPFSHGEAGDLAAFTESLIALADPEDENVLESVYRLCECAQGQGTRLRDLPIRQQEKAGGRQRDFMYESGEQMQTHSWDAQPDTGFERNARHTEQMEEGIWYDGGIPVKEPEPQRKPKKGISMSLLAFLFAVILLADIYVRKEYLLTPVGNILSLVVIGIGAAGLLGSLLCARRAGRKQDDQEDVPTSETDAEEKADAFASAALWDDLYEQDAEPATHQQVYGQEYGMPYRPAYDAQSEADHDTGTVFLTPKKRARTAKLYGRDNVHNCHVPLERLPLTLGKLAGQVDFLLRDESVSRIHAHISRGGDGQICIRDLNSTNGTFLNGIRLVPNETVRIREGDEVCFGDMVFEYL